METTKFVREVAKVLVSGIAKLALNRIVIVNITNEAASGALQLEAGASPLLLPLNWFGTSSLKSRKEQSIVSRKTSRKTLHRHKTSHASPVSDRWSRNSCPKNAGALVLQMKLGAKNMSLGYLICTSRTVTFVMWGLYRHATL